MKFRNKNTGQIIEGSDEEMVKVLTILKQRGEIGDWETFNEEAVETPVREATNVEPKRTTYQERKDYFKDTSPVLAEVFPNIAEQYMNGNSGYNLGTVRAGISDMLSLPGRAISGAANKSNLIGGSGEFNLGVRSSDPEVGLIEKFSRDPITGLTAGAGGALASGVKLGANAGGELFGTAGRYLGAGLAGANEGALLEKGSELLNDRNATVKDLAIGAGLGGAFELLGTGIQSILQKFGKDYVKAVASSLRLGNTDRVMTDDEFVEFLADPRNRDALEKALKAGSKGLNSTPFVGDRGKKLQPEVNKAKSEAESILQGEDAFKGFEEGVDKNLPIGEQDMQRRLNALRMKQNGETESMNLARPYKEGQLNAQDMDFNPMKEREPWERSSRSETKITSYEPNAFMDMERFSNKYKKMSSEILKKPSVDRPMTQDEFFLLDQLKKEMDGDKSIIAGYTPEKVISSNKFLSDHTPFNDGFYKNTLKPFLDENKNVSTDFLTEFHRILGGTEFAKNKSNELREALSGLEEASLKRAFTKSDKNIEVKKGYDQAMKKFKDTLSSYADMRVGRPGVNANGQDYIVGEENMKDYAYTYLRHVQDALSRNGVVKPDEIVSLYGMATNVNDKTVQDAIIQLLRDLNVSESAVKKFEQVGGNYAMLNKARTRMKKNANEDNPFKGTVIAPIVPQEGFNTKNAIGYKLQGGNINLGDLSTTSNPTIPGIIVRDIYNLGMTPFRANRDK